jgi:hypothetical protein
VILTVEDISSRGWEGVRYRVLDVEEEFVGFYARDIVGLESSGASP